MEMKRKALTTVCAIAVVLLTAAAPSVMAQYPSGQDVAREAMAKAQAEKARNDEIVRRQREQQEMQRREQEQRVRDLEKAERRARTG
jgi:hypothetical protein